MNAANWIRQNENAYKIGFAWGFEPSDDEPKGTLRDIPAREAPARNERSPSLTPTKQKNTEITEFRGVLAGIRNWFGKYF